VAQSDPLVAVVASLTAPSDFTPEPEPVAKAVELVPRTRMMSHGPFARDPAAIAVIKQRESIDRRLYAVTFDDLKGNRWFWLVAAERSERGWVAHGVAGGSNGPAERERATPRPSSVGARPWLNLCGHWGGETFYAGGRLDRAGAEIGRVQLTLDDGRQLQDDGLGDVSLFIGRHGESPRTVDIYAPDGALLSSHNA
jgi:hypothetical protein